MKFYTIGYGGRMPSDFTRILVESGVQTVADVRLYPERASMGSYVRAKTQGKGIQGLLERSGIGYASLPELGNPFLKDLDWTTKYTELIAKEGDLRIKGLALLPEPFCLLCAEKKVVECHRLQIAEFLVSKGHELLGHL